MADNDRSLYCMTNIGIETLAVLERDLYAVENIGIEILPVAERDLYAFLNVGVEIIGVLLRALYAMFNVAEDTSPEDALEVLLVAADIFTVEWILRGK